MAQREQAHWLAQNRIHDVAVGVKAMAQHKQAHWLAQTRTGALVDTHLMPCGIARRPRELREVDGAQALLAHLPALVLAVAKVLAGAAWATTEPCRTNVYLQSSIGAGKGGSAGGGGSKLAGKGEVFVSKDATGARQAPACQAPCA